MTRNRNTQFFVALLAAAALSAWAVTGCELIASVDRSRIAGAGGEGTGGEQPNGGGGTGGTGGTGGGGGPECDPLTCDGVDTDCRFRACDASEMCGFENAMAKDPCDDGASGNALVCDGVGTCVECVDNADCTFDVMATVCDANVCVPATCIDGTLNGDETDIDCGGDDCAPCPDGDTCGEDIDCVSLFCDATVCTACDADADCLDLAGHFCDLTAGVTDCVPKLALGAVCPTGASNQCVGTPGFCVTEPGQPNGVCCNGLCGATDCESCRQVDHPLLGAGECGPITLTDPYNECALSGVNAGVCEGADCSGTTAACAPAPNTLTCRNDSDGATGCDAAEVCNGTSLSCGPDVNEQAGTACGSSSDTQCDDPDTCNSGGTCQPNNVAGNCTGAINGGQCNLQDTCTAGACVDVFAAVGASCGVNDDCKTPTCAAMGVCNQNNETAGTPCDEGVDEPTCNPKVCDGNGTCPVVTLLTGCVACTEVPDMTGGCDAGVCEDPCL